MALSIASLNSGSNGNCYYIGNDRDAVLIDAGLSCKETERRMLSCGLSMDRVRAIFISHEHTDHIKGLERLSRKYELPVYITAATLVNSPLQLDPRQVRSFDIQQAVSIGDLEIKAFLKTHDAADPHSFLVSGHGVRIGIFTDLGYVCEGLSSHFALCHAAFLEANYDRYMLDNGRYPYALRRRISGGKGHLSNDEALELFRNWRPHYMSHLLLSHLSRDNNDPQLVRDLFLAENSEVEIIIASRDVPTAVYRISADASAPVIKEPAIQQQRGQLSLF